MFVAHLCFSCSCWHTRPSIDWTAFNKTSFELSIESYLGASADEVVVTYSSSRRRRLHDALGHVQSIPEFLKQVLVDGALGLANIFHGATSAVLEPTRRQLSESVTEIVTIEFLASSVAEALALMKEALSADDREGAVETKANSRLADIIDEECVASGKSRCMHNFFLVA